MGGITLYSDGAIRIKKQTYQGENDAMPEHTHDFLSISLMLNGFLREESELGNSYGHGSLISIKPPNLKHSDIFTDSSSFISLQIIDPKWFGLDEQDWRWISPSTSLATFLNVLNAEDKRDAVRNLGKHLEATRNENREAKPDWLKQTHAILRTHYTEPIKVSELAQRVNKHPVYLTRAFKNYYGSDIKTFQKNLRLGHALAQKLNTDKSLTEIAYESGFSDQSHFNREFKKATGFTPKKSLKV